MAPGPAHRKTSFRPAVFRLFYHPTLKDLSFEFGDSGWRWPVSSPPDASVLTTLSIRLHKSQLDQLLSVLPNLTTLRYRWSYLPKIKRPPLEEQPEQDPADIVDRFSLPPEAQDLLSNNLEMAAFQEAMKESEAIERGERPTLPLPYLEETRIIDLDQMALGISKLSSSLEELEITAQTTHTILSDYPPPVIKLHGSLLRLADMPKIKKLTLPWFFAEHNTRDGHEFEDFPNGHISTIIPPAIEVLIFNSNLMVAHSTISDPEEEDGYKLFLLKDEYDTQRMAKFKALRVVRLPLVQKVPSEVWNNVADGLRDTHDCSIKYAYQRKTDGG